jgi:hypothetical protein
MNLYKLGCKASVALKNVNSEKTYRILIFERNLMQGRTVFDVAHIRALRRPDAEKIGRYRFRVPGIVLEETILNLIWGHPKEKSHDSG